MKKATSNLLLLDVNVLLAIAWPNHQFHAAAIARLESSDRWATCALTQLGFIRLSSNPAVVPGPRPPGEAAALLHLMTRDAQHLYLESLPSPVAGDFGEVLERILGHGKVADSYLLALARRHKATFLTFDARMKHLKAPGARHEILGQPA